MNGTNRDEALGDLLLDLFEPSEARRLVESTFGDVVHHLPGDKATPAEFFAGMVRALSRRGLEDEPEFFGAVLDERPGRFEDVQRVAHLYGVELAAPETGAPVVQPVAPPSDTSSSRRFLVIGGVLFAVVVVVGVAAFLWAPRSRPGPPTVGTITRAPCEAAWEGDVSAPALMGIQWSDRADITVQVDSSTSPRSSLASRHVRVISSDRTDSTLVSECELLVPVRSEDRRLHAELDKLPPACIAGIRAAILERCDARR